MGGRKLYLVAKYAIRSFLTVVLLAAYAACFAQEQQQPGIELQKYVPLSPNAAELGKYGTYPVGMITGTPEISYSLFTVQSGELSLPVTLSYHASGIKVNQMATWAGLGWSVNAGGTISRTVYGMTDEKSHGFMDSAYNHPRAKELRENTYYDALFARISASGDMEPDLFVYTVGNKSGKFIYNRDGNFMTIPYAPVKINFSRPNNTEDIIFEITDDDGAIYQFNDIDHTVIDDQGLKIYAGSWYLTRIVSASRKDTIAFTYQANTVENSIKSYYCTVGQTVGGCPGQAIVERFSGASNGELQPAEITFRGGKLVFSTTDFRKDGGGRQLDNITQYARAPDGTYTFVKQVNLLHSYFLSTPFYENRDNYRLKLDGFNFSDAGGNVEKEYRFEYNSLVLPPHNANSQDYFGFYNGKNNPSLIPVTTLLRGQLSSDFMSGVGGNAGVCAVPMTLGDADRNPDPAYMKACMLEKIIYPTKGYSIFEFEPHAYQLSFYPVQQQKAAIVPRLYGAADQSIREAKATFSVGTYPGGYAKVTIAFSPTPPNPIGGDPQQVILRNLTTGESRMWLHTGNLTAAQNITENELVINPGNSYELVVKVEAGTDTYVDAGIEWPETEYQTIQKQGGGLRIKSIKNYSKDAALATEEMYTYGTTDDGVGEAVFDYDYFSQSYTDAMTEQAVREAGPSGGGINICRPERSFFRTYQGVADNTSITYMGSPVLYPKVIKYNGRVDNNAGKTEYYYDINKPRGYMPHTFMAGGNYGSLDNAWYQGNLVKEAVFKRSDNTYLPVSEKNYKYDQFNLKSEYGVALRRYCTGDVNCGNTTWVNGMAYYTFYEYEIKTGINKLISEETVLYDQSNTGNTIRTSKTYTYDNTVHFYPAEISSTDSKRRPVREQMKYTFDLAGSDPVLNRMVSKNMIAAPMESYRYLDNNLVFSEKNAFDSWNGNIDLIKPLKKEVLYGSSTNPLRIEYHAYDDFGNVTEQAKANDANEVYLWGYDNRYPVAKVVGSNHTAVAALVDLGLLQNPPGDQQLRTELHKIRTALAGKALVTTYTYKPLVGMTSETDPTGRTTYYEYDAFGRLKLVRDKDQRIIKTFDYHYKE